MDADRKGGCIVLDPFTVISLHNDVFLCLCQHYAAHPIAHEKGFVQDSGNSYIEVSQNSIFEGPQIAISLSWIAYFRPRRPQKLPKRPLSLSQLSIFWSPMDIGDSSLGMFGWLNTSIIDVTSH